MSDRRHFLKTTALGAALGPALLEGCSPGEESAPGSAQQPSGAPVRPVALSTWEHGLAANAAAW